MRHEPGDVVARLGGDLTGQALLLGVGGAGEEEVLPDEHAALVADPVEVVALVHAAAPDAQQVDVRVEGLADPRPQLKEALDAVAAMLAASIAVLVATFVAPLNQNTVIIASLIVLLPGMGHDIPAALFQQITDVIRRTANRA